MRRYDDWPSKLTALLEERAREPFAWGTNDCGTFCADAIEAMTGADPAAELRGKYKGKKGAVRALEKAGGGDLASYVQRLAREQGWQSVSSMLARRGDLMLFEPAQGPMVGINVGASAAAPGEHGLVWLPASSAVNAWRIG